MGRDLMLTLLCSCILCATALSQSSAPRQLSPAEEAETERVIGIVKNLPSHTLDHRLPTMGFGEWVQAEVGPDTNVTWVYIADFDHPDPSDCVEVHIHAQDRRDLIIDVAVGKAVHRPHVLSVLAVRGSQFADARMRDVPSMLHKIRQESDGTH